MIKTVENFLKRYLDEKNTFYVGFSGGYDSLCLLDIMVNLSKVYHFKVAALHLNHNFRGQDSFDEQEKCQKIAEYYEIEFITETLEKQNNHSEEFAREERYKFFEKYVNDKDNSFVLTAHNLNDNVETLIYRIAKGTGIKGLTGIPEHTVKNGVTYLRPLLKVSRNDIEEYCKKIPFEPNHDSSNDDNLYKRNLIRNSIMKLLKEINPEVEKSIISLSELAKESEVITDNVLEEYFKDNTIYYDKFLGAIEPLKSEIIHRFLIDNKIEYDRKKITEITEFLTDKNNLKKKYSLASNIWIKFDENKIYTVLKSKKNNNEIKISGEGVYELFSGGIFEIVKTNKRPEKFPKETDLEAIVDLSGFDSLVLRTRRDGDIIHPFGMEGSMKLKKYLISKKVPQEKRDSIILLASGKEVLWVTGVGLSEKIKVAKNPTNMLKYKYQ